MLQEEEPQARKRTTEVSESSSVRVKEEKDELVQNSNKRPNLTTGTGATVSPGSSVATARSPIRSKSPGFTGGGVKVGGGPSQASSSSSTTTQVMSGGVGATTKRRWSKLEDEKLCAAVKGVGLHDWKTIAEVYMAGHELSDAQCMHRWQKVLRPGLVKGAFCEKEDKVIVDCLREGGLKRRWTKQEDEKLCNAVKALGTENWKEIAEVHLAGHGRSEAQCLNRWQKVLRAGLVKGAFTEDEDKIIIECMQEGGLTWMQIADRIPGRIGKQCRERWTNHLDPNLKKGGWSHDEDTILAEAQRRWGNAWTKIAKLLPGRAENAVKNRWNSAFRRKKSAMFGKVPAEEDTEAVIQARLQMEAIDREEHQRETANEAHSVPSKPRGTKRTNRHQQQASSNGTRGTSASNAQRALNIQRASIEAFQSSQLYNEEPSPADANAGLVALSGGHYSSTTDDDAATLTRRSGSKVRSYKPRGNRHGLGGAGTHTMNIDSGASQQTHQLGATAGSDSPSMDALDQFFVGNFAGRGDIDEGFLSLGGVEEDDHGIHLRSVDLDVSLDNLDLGVDPSDFGGRHVGHHHTDVNDVILEENDDVDDQVNFFGPGRSGLTTTTGIPKTSSSGILPPPLGGVPSTSSFTHHAFNPFGSGLSVNALCTSQDDLDLPPVDVNASIDRSAGGHLSAGDFRRRSVSLGDEYMSQEYATSWQLLESSKQPLSHLPHQHANTNSSIHSIHTKDAQPLLRNISTATDATAAVTMDHTMTTAAL